MNPTTARTERKIDPMNVKNIEEVIYLLQESEADYSKNGGMPAEEAYMKGLEYINKLGK